MPEQESRINVALPTSVVAALRDVFGGEEDDTLKTLQAQVSYRTSKLETATAAVEAAKDEVAKRVALDEHSEIFHHPDTVSEQYPGGRFSPLSSLVKRNHVDEAKIELAKAESRFFDAEFYLALVTKALDDYIT